MFSYGFMWYGPLQYYWYNLLDHVMPVKTTMNFAMKVLLNQVVLGPITVSSAFTWNLALQGKADEIPSKIARDMLPTMLNGWKFWVPAASINFYCIPVAYQVLYMSCCGVLWTAYVSYASSSKVGES